MLRKKFDETANQHQQLINSGRIKKYRSKPFRICEILISTLLSTPGIKSQSYIRTPINTESVRETFYHELIQNTSLPTNHNFASIITEINKEIEHHTQQRYPITYSSKGKGKLQTPAVTFQQIQPPTWKKHRVESPTNPSYNYTIGSTIHITSPNVKQRKTELLGPYDEYFEGFQLQTPTPLGIQLPPPSPDFGIANL
ncbi:hypothetical protein G9A89_013799 [Geosiphon pyriformis]|nr:hypothetical protein G9A89_013799 [Geosiphon pyriformis]